MSLLIVCLFGIFFSAIAKEVVVSIDYEVPSGRTYYIVINRFGIRNTFPPEDILINKMTFDNVYVDKVQVQSFHGGCDSLYCYHHTALHQSGSNMSTVFNHNFGAFAGGTGMGEMSGKPETIKFEKSGIRLRPTAELNTCLHARNLDDKAIIFTVNWIVEYEILESPEPINNSLMSAMIGLHPLNKKSIPLNIIARQPNRDISDYLFEYSTELQFKKDVRVVFISLHIHTWYRGMIWSKDGIPIYRHTQEYGFHEFPMEWLTQSISVKSGESLIATISGKVESSYVGLQDPGLGLVLFVICDDGTDHIDNVEDLYTTSQIPFDVKFHLEDSQDGKLTALSHHVHVQSE